MIGNPNGLSGMKLDRGRQGLQHAELRVAGQSRRASFSCPEENRKRRRAEY